jgi:hypothetical protein
MSLYPQQNNPYYIYAPRYVRASAGIRVLYLLCHHLNLRGYQAYMVATCNDRHEEEVYDLIAPTLTEEILQFHFKQKRCPVVVYPETTIGNPLRAPVVARYVLNYPGLLGGDKEYNSKEMIFTYTEKLASSITNHVPEIMYMPVCDTNIFYPPETSAKRSGSSFYAAKYQEVHNGKLKDITKKSFEITRHLSSSLNQHQIAELFRKSEVFYTYENSSLAIEATLCGCPAVFIPNEFLTEEPLALKETGTNGIAFGIDSEKIDEAKKTVHLAFENYIESLNDFDKSLDNFIRITQKRAQETTYKKLIICTFYQYKITLNLNFFEGYRRFRKYYRKYGLSKTVKRIIRFVFQ